MLTDTPQRVSGTAVRSRTLSVCQGINPAVRSKRAPPCPTKTIWPL